MTIYWPLKILCIVMMNLIFGYICVRILYKTMRQHQMEWRHFGLIQIGQDIATKSLGRQHTYQRRIDLSRYFLQPLGRIRPMMSKNVDAVVWMSTLLRHPDRLEPIWSIFVVTHLASQNQDYLWSRLNLKTKDFAGSYYCTWNSCRLCLDFLLVTSFSISSNTIELYTYKVGKPLVSSTPCFKNHIRMSICDKRYN